MSWDISLTADRPTVVFETNITFNLNTMANAVGVLGPVLNPSQPTKATSLLPLLRSAIARMEAEPCRFQRYNPTNGIGSYEELLAALKALLKACRENPDAEYNVVA